MKSIVVTVPHALGVAEAKRRVDERIAVLRSMYIDKLAQTEVAWTGDRADVRVVALAQEVTAHVDVAADTLRIEVHLPWLLAALSGKVEGLLASNAKETLLLGRVSPKA